MPKKDFKGGLNNLIKNMNNTLPENKVVPAVKEGCLPKETRATFIISEDLLFKLKAIAFFERKQIKKAVGEALENYISSKGDSAISKAIKEYKKALEGEK